MFRFIEIYNHVQNNILHRNYKCLSYKAKKYTRVKFGFFYLHADDKLYVDVIEEKKLLEYNYNFPSRTM